MTRRDLLISSLVAASAARGQPAGPSRAAVERHLEAIRSHDGELRSVIEINPDALALADSLDRERSPRSPLHGSLVLIKDNIETADRMKTTAGSLALVDTPVPKADAPLVERLRKAGAVILGKTNLSEWANFRSSHSISGWSGRGGQTRNPHALDRNPSGSSSGSAAAVAAGFCSMAVGTETDGSIVSPASTCGIVGIKPTVGSVPGEGIIPIAHSQDTAGPMARTVAEAAQLLTVLSTRGEDYAKGLDKGALKGARLGVPRKLFGFNAAVDKVIDGAIDAMKRSGAEAVEVEGFSTDPGDAEFQVLLYEFKTDLNAYLERRGGAVRSLKQLIEFNEKNREREMPWFGQETLESAEKKGPLSENAYLEALAKCRRIYRDEGIDAVTQKHKLDAIVAPTTGLACLIDYLNGDYGSGGCSTPAAVAGYPHITVPAGFVHGLPLGISFFGPAWTDAKLIQLAYAFEQLTQARRDPTFAPTIKLGA